MCGRYVLWTPAEELTAIFDTDFRIGEVTPTYNAAPSQQLPIVFERYEEEPGRVLRRMQTHQWGAGAFLGARCQPPHD